MDAGLVAVDAGARDEIVETCVDAQVALRNVTGLPRLAQPAAIDGELSFSQPSACTSGWLSALPSPSTRQPSFVVLPRNRGQVHLKTDADPFVWLFEHALYVTINDIVLNAGTPHELRRPFEIFINSKNMDHFQWIVALTRILSAVFRKGDVTFIVEELKAVFDPRGGYFKSGGVYMPSIVAEIGAVIEQHRKNIGLIHDPEMDEVTRKLIAEKRVAYEQAGAEKRLT